MNPKGSPRFGPGYPWDVGGREPRWRWWRGALVWGGLLGATVSERPEGGGGIVGLGLGQWTGAEHVDFGNSRRDWKPYAWVDPSRPRAWSLRRRTPGPWALGFGGRCREGRGAGVVPPKGRPWEPLGPQDCGRTRSGRAGMDTTQPVTPLRQVYCRTRHPFLIGPIAGHLRGWECSPWSQEEPRGDRPTRAPATCVVALTRLPKTRQRRVMERMGAAGEHRAALRAAGRAPLVSCLSKRSHKGSASDTGLGANAQSASQLHGQEHRAF